MSKQKSNKDESKQAPATDVSALLQEVECALNGVRGHMAAYLRFAGCYRSLTQPGADAPRNLPVLTFKASHDGVSVVDVAQDLNTMPPADAARVILILGQAQSESLLSASSWLKDAVSALAFAVEEALQADGAECAAPQGDEPIDPCDEVTR